MPALYDHHFGYSLMVGIFGIRYQFSARHFALNWPAAVCLPTLKFLGPLTQLTAKKSMAYISTFVISRLAVELTKLIYIVNG